MRKRYSLLVSLIAFIVLAGCANKAQSAATTEQPTVVPRVEMDAEKSIESPTEAEKDIERVETAYATETPTPTPNPYEIGGMDFKNYMDRDLGWWIGDITAKYKFEELRIIVFNNYRGNTMDIMPVAVIQNGDEYTLTLDEEKKYDTFLNTYAFMIYTPRPCKGFKLKGEDDPEAFYKSDFWYEEIKIDTKQYNLVPAIFMVNFNKQEELHNAELSVIVTYEDDTQDTITVYITKDFILNY